MRIPEFSVRHSVFGNMLTVVVIVAGILIVSDMKREVFPDIPLDMVTITTAYPSASPEEVEQLITAPIEDELREIEGISTYTSSSIEGLSMILVELDPDARYKDRIINEIQRKVDQIRDFPAEAQDPRISIISTQGPVIRVAVSGPAGERAVRDAAEHLKSRFEQIADIGRVTRTGWRDEEFWVELDPAQLDAYDVSVVDVSEALRLRNVTLPGGTLRENNREMALRTLGQFHSEAEIEAVIVRSDRDGNQIRVKDVGAVRRTLEDESIFVKANGTRAIMLGIKKKDRADTIGAVRAVMRVVEEERERLGEGIAITVVDDESYYVSRRLHVLSMNGLLGMMFVMICLFLFLNFRVALITAIGIPFSFLSAFLLMKLYGVTINMMTMFGLIVVLGMVVDDAIIVGENIFRHLEMGKTPRAAAIEGTQEVMYPLITTVLTTCAAFLPLMFAPDIYADFLKWLPIVVIMALAGSLFESLVILPCHVADFVPPFKSSKNGGRNIRHAHRWMAALLGWYTRNLNTVLKWRYAFLGLVLSLFTGVGVWSYHTMRIDVFPDGLIDVFIVRVTADEGTALASTEAIVADVESVISALPASELSDVIAYVGAHIDIMGYTGRGSHLAALAVYLPPQNKRDRSTRDIIAQLRRETDDIEGVHQIEFETLSPGPPVGRPLEAKVVGRDFDVLQRLAATISKYLETHRGVNDIAVDFQSGKEELHVRIDYATAARLGLDAAMIAQTISTSFQGFEATGVREGANEISVRVRLAEPYRNDPGAIDWVRVRNRQGRLIPLSAVATVERAVGLPTIEHYMGERVITVSADIDTDVTSSVEVNRALLAEFGDLHREHPGYRMILTGEWEETAKLVDFIIKAFSIAILVIFSILVVQFNSLSQPFVVILSIPLGLIGVTVALIAHDMPISVMAMMGMVGLAGVAVNDAIVLVNFINHRRREGASVHDAVHQAGTARLRPIVLTTVTTMSGLLPVIYGWGGYEPFIAPSAVTLGYGLLVASFLTLFVVPSLYYVAEDARKLIRRR